MEQFSIISLPATEGIALMCEMLKSQYIAELMTGSGVSNRVYLSSGISHSLVNGKPYYFNEKQIEELQNIATTVGTQLMSVTMTAQPQSEQASPMCYGNDYVQKFKVLRQYINLPYIFMVCMGRTEGWRKMHLSRKTEARYYNTFTESELEEINCAIRTIALRLCALRFTNDEIPEGCERKVYVKREKPTSEEPTPETPEQSFPDPFADFN